MAEAEILPSGEFGVPVLAQEETTTEEQVAIAGTETIHNDEDNNDQGAAAVNLSNDSMDPPAPNLTKESPPRTSPTKQQQEQQPASSLDNPNESSDAPLPSPENFVNNGLKRWTAARDEWCRRPSDGNHSNQKHFQAVPIDVDGIIDVLFDPRWRGGAAAAAAMAGGKLALKPPRFPTNVPLPQMIDVLTDLWEAEGLDV